MSALADGEDGTCSRCGQPYETRNDGGDPPYLCDPCAQEMVVQLSLELSRLRSQNARLLSLLKTVRGSIGIGHSLQIEIDAAIKASNA